jgi:phage-related protein
MEAGLLLRRLQRGEFLAMPHSRPMPDIGRGCHELRIRDGNQQWRLIYHLAPHAVVILDVFAKKTRETPKAAMDDCRRRLAEFQRASEAGE